MSFKTVVRSFILPLILCSAFHVNASAQNFALKTNLLYDATATLNLGAEVGLAPKWTFDLSGNMHFWNAWGEKRLRHWLIQPEARYWFCERFNGHFLGFHALGGQYNFGNIRNNISWFPWGYNTVTNKFGAGSLVPMTDHRFQGWGVGAGVAYGYSFILGQHWNLELELGLGYIYTQYDVYQCKDCGKKIREKDPYHYVGPTKAAVNLVYEF